MVKTLRNLKEQLPFHLRWMQKENTRMSPIDTKLNEY